jgi:MarR family transcriptional regulator, negative regulator of the multidrug operon emrRAB
VSAGPDRALENVLAALALALTDRISDAIERTAGRAGQGPAALVALHEVVGGGTIEQLRQVLGLSHSAAVRLVDRLVTDGHVFRSEGVGDGRTVALALTPAGRSVARRILAARAGAVRELLATLSDEELRSLQALLGKLLGSITETRLNERTLEGSSPGGWLCRVCDFEACGRPTNKCPAANAAARFDTHGALTTGR